MMYSQGIGEIKHTLNNAQLYPIYTNIYFPLVDNGYDYKFSASCYVGLVNSSTPNPEPIIGWQSNPELYNEPNVRTLNIDNLRRAAYPWTPGCYKPTTYTIEYQMTYNGITSKPTYISFTILWNDTDN